jgi:hypothetical protein
MATPFTSQISKVYLLLCSIILHFAINFQRYAASLKIYDLFRIKFGAASLNHPHCANSISQVRKTIIGSSKICLRKRWKCCAGRRREICRRRSNCTGISPFWNVKHVDKNGKRRSDGHLFLFSVNAQKQLTIGY